MSEPSTLKKYNNMNTMMPKLVSCPFSVKHPWYPLSKAGSSQTYERSPSAASPILTQMTYIMNYFTTSIFDNIIHTYELNIYMPIYIGNIEKNLQPICINSQHIMHKYHIHISIQTHTSIHQISIYPHIQQRKTCSSIHMHSSTNFNMHLSIQIEKKNKSNIFIQFVHPYKGI